MEKALAYQEIIVPTSEIIKNELFSHVIIKNYQHILLLGQTATGKTLQTIT